MNYVKTYEGPSDTSLSFVCFPSLGKKDHRDCLEPGSEIFRDLFTDLPRLRNSEGSCVYSTPFETEQGISLFMSRHDEVSSLAIMRRKIVGHVCDGGGGVARRASRGPSRRTGRSVGSHVSCTTIVFHGTHRRSSIDWV